MTIRPMTPQDIPVVFDLYNQTKLDELAFEAKSFSLIPLAQDDARRTAFLESDVYVYEDGQILGVGAVYQNEIRALFVSPLARKQGIAKVLLGHLISCALRPVVLTVVTSNTPAKRLYGHFGFADVDETVASYNGVSVKVSEMATGVVTGVATDVATDVAT